MLTKKTIGFLGAGNMAEALIRGLLSSKKVSPGQIIASDRFKDRLVHMAEAYEVKVYNKNYEVVKGADIVFLTVKPGDLPGLLEELRAEMDSSKLIISIAAGVTTDTILNIIKKPVPVIRGMPNTPATVLEGATALFAGPGAGEEEVKIARSIFEAVGSVIVLKDESLMDAVTGLSGSGPAYIFLIMEAMVKAGIELGIPEKSSRQLSVQTALGAARLALESKAGLDELIDKVTSPGGTTVEGLKKLKEADIQKTIIEAVKAAARRAKELSGTK